MSASGPTSILLVEGDVLIRMALAEYLRGCGFIVVEAANAVEAKVVLQEGPVVKHLLADAQLAGADSGFALAQWVRRYRPEINVVLMGSLASKTDAVAELCSDGDTRRHASDGLAQAIQNMRGRRSHGAGRRARILRQSV